jgi:xanthine dehydrogenase YagS FAD-binding subunit
MNRFRYANATSTESAREMLGANGVYLAGGNDLLGLLKESIAEPDLLVNLKTIPGLDRIEPGDQKWVFGSGVTVAQLEDHEGIRQTFPGLHQAAAEVASRQIRNVATLGGNPASTRAEVLSPPRHLLPQEGRRHLPRPNGENKFHSLFSGNLYQSDGLNLAVILTALDAVVVQREAERSPYPAEFFSAPDNPTLHHSLERSDLILRVEVPTRWSRSTYLQVAEKAAFDWATVSCAAAVQMAGGRVEEGRVVLGSVAPVPYQVAAANSLMRGQPLNAALGAQVAERLLRDATPLATTGTRCRSLGPQRALRQVRWPGRNALPAPAQQGCCSGACRWASTRRTARPDRPAHYWEPDGNRAG